MAQKNPSHFGIDVGAAALVVAKDGDSDTHTFDNTPEGRKQLVRFINKRAPAVVVVEATGTYGLDLACALDAKKHISLRYINPVVAKGYTGLGPRRAKTDHVDAKLLARLARMEPDLPEWQRPLTTHVQLRALTRRVRTLVEERTREKNRRAALRATKTTPAYLLEDIEHHISYLDGRLSSLREHAIELAKGDVHLKEMLELITSVRGIADDSGIEILGELCCLPSDLTPRQLVAQAGLDPRPNDSGKSQGARRISRAGNKYLRAAMHMPAINSVNHCPEVRYFFEHLHKTKGKKKLVAYVAVSRKLLRCLHGMLATKVPWDPSKFYQPTMLNDAHAT